MQREKWFKERTYSASDFNLLPELEGLKREKGASVTVCLPTLNVEETVGEIVCSIRKEFMERSKLVDQLMVVDGNSQDRTLEQARKAGAEIYLQDEIFPQAGKSGGKGEALWKSLAVARGSIIIWIDSDISNFEPHFVTGLLGPLLENDEIVLIKGFYRRPIKQGEKIEKEGGGRVTEILVRPWLNLFYPQLSMVLQPLSGEYGGRRDVFKTLPFFTGYGVEIGLLIEVWRKYGLEGLAQVNLEERVHTNKTTTELGKMSFAILQALLTMLVEEGRLIKEPFWFKNYLLPQPEAFFSEERVEVVKKPPLIEWEKHHKKA